MYDEATGQEKRVPKIRIEKPAPEAREDWLQNKEAVDLMTKHRSDGRGGYKEVSQDYFNRFYPEGSEPRSAVSFQTCPHNFGSQEKFSSLTNLILQTKSGHFEYF